MAGDPGQPDPVVEPSGDPIPPEPSPTPSKSFVNADGTLEPGWQDALVPEDFRGRTIFNAFTDVKGLVKQVGHQAALIGRQGKGIMKPTKESTETEVDLYYEALGRPKTPEEYTFTPPEGLEEHYEGPLLAQAKSAMHKAGLTQEQVDVVMALDVQRLQSSGQSFQAAQETARKAAETDLIQEWGAKYAENLALANRVVAENVPDDQKHELLEIIGNNPVVARCFATVGAKFMEGGLIDADAASGALTPVEADNQMKELMQQQANEPNMRWEKPALFERLNKEIDRLALISMTTAGQS